MTAPSDPREKEADVDRKMRLYGIISGFREVREGFHGRLACLPVPQG